MKLFLLIFLFLIIPIPIKISISYKKEKYYIKIYKFNILKKQSLNKEIIRKKEKLYKKFDKNRKFEKGYLIEILKALNKNHFKPKLKLKGDFQYSLNDAAKTAIFYGILQSIGPYILEGFKVFFKIKSFKLFIKPIFKDKFIGIFDITCIIFLSFGKTIIIICLIIKAVLIKKIKEGLYNEQQSSRS